MSSRTLVFIFVGLAILFSGCATLKEKTSSFSASKELEVSALLKFDDVPVPDGFNFIASESFAFQTNDVRVGVLKYQGRANPDAIILFYKEQMPLYNWKTINIVEYGRRVLNFEKNDQTCAVTIDAKGSKVFLVIVVSPRSGREVFEK